MYDGTPMSTRPPGGLADPSGRAADNPAALSNRPTFNMDYMLRSLTMMATVLVVVLGVLSTAMLLLHLFFHLWDRFAERGLPTRRPLRRKRRRGKP